jgi:hypothetical protein
MYAYGLTTASAFTAREYECILLTELKRQLSHGECLRVTYNIHAERTCFTKSRTFGVSGEVR